MIINTVIIVDSQYHIEGTRSWTHKMHGKIIFYKQYFSFLNKNLIKLHYIKLAMCINCITVNKPIKFKADILTTFHNEAQNCTTHPSETYTRAFVFLDKYEHSCTKCPSSLVLQHFL